MSRCVCIAAAGSPSGDSNSFCITADHLREYHERGFLLLPNVFDEDEIRCLKEQLPTLLEQDSARRVLEKDGKSVRSLYGVHATDPLFGRLTRDRRIIHSIEKILGGPVYIYQSKINSKSRSGGDLWAWHQDFIFWAKEDGLRTPQLSTAAVFLDDVSDFNGPMEFLPGSHGKIIDVHGYENVPKGYENAPAWVFNLTAELKYSIPEEIVARLRLKLGVATPKGPAGSVLLFHPNVVHGSSPNVSALDRTLVLITYNSVCNPPPDSDSCRPAFLCSRDYAAIVPAETPLRDELAGEIVERCDVDRIS